MAAYAAMREITALIRAYWPHTTVRSLDEDARPHVPTDASGFAEITFPFSEEIQRTTGSPGNNRFEESGGFRLSIFIPAKASLETWMQWIDTLRDVLRNNHDLCSGQLRIFEVSSPVINDANDRVGYRELSIAVPYEYDIYK